MALGSAGERFPGIQKKESPGGLSFFSSKQIIYRATPTMQEMPLVR